eukprot:TRINITY_DN3655_c0_g3_i1.p1 TRINITY_DN3655_c0_g3~~TRINITY_DN3655_c0_g3_i1.p1  ORF type:complete len:317 (-),score=63.30 TRINITY_DN3655_c0_g3_i1:156-1106(-)
MNASFWPILLLIVCSVHSKSVTCLASDQCPPDLIGVWASYMARDEVQLGDSGMLPKVFFDLTLIFYDDYVSVGIDYSDKTAIDQIATYEYCCRNYQEGNPAFSFADGKAIKGGKTVDKFSCTNYLINSHDFDVFILRKTHMTEVDRTMYTKQMEPCDDGYNAIFQGEIRYIPPYHTGQMVGQLKDQPEFWALSAMAFLFSAGWFYMFWTTRVRDKGDEEEDEEDEDNYQPPAVKKKEVIRCATCAAMILDPLLSFCPTCGGMDRARYDHESGQWISDHGGNNMQQEEFEMMPMGNGEQDQFYGEQDQFYGYDGEFF